VGEEEEFECGLFGLKMERLGGEDKLEWMSGMRE
jgi:hypothetical protein